MRKIAISDIHGFAHTLKVLVTQVLEVKPGDELFFLGDYVDRGPDSKGVMDFIMQLQDAGYNIRCLRGNHEDMMIQGQANVQMQHAWLKNGGDTTLTSFNAKTLASVPEKYWNFLNGLEYYAEAGRFLMVHAGLKFGLLDPLLNKQFMMWGRYWYGEIDNRWLGDRVIVHGHTPTAELEIRSSLRLEEFPVINIDNGCYATWRTGMGQLCAFDMTNHKLHFLKNCDVIVE